MIKVFWLFMAYKSETEYLSNNPFFIKEFNDFDEMKKFSAQHSSDWKSQMNEYCSIYYNIKR